MAHQEAKGVSYEAERGITKERYTVSLAPRHMGKTGFGEAVDSGIRAMSVEIDGEITGGSMKTRVNSGDKDVYQLARALIECGSPFEDMEIYSDRVVIDFGEETHMLTRDVLPAITAVLNVVRRKTGRERLEWSRESA